MTFTRTLTPERIAQGFKSQEHLDAFYRSYDHHKACSVCSSPGPFFPLDDGMQPSMQECLEGRRLFLASFPQS